ncbi:uncharacterized protein [Temnothorax longispinosus]|uniref:uncharacterized protein n=1 Tax=Temnothorax longispinosus TaxID=300112 RepID=UPI003A9A4C63
MHVQNSKIKSTKKNCCTFCMKLQSQLARHLQNVHYNEPEVKKFAVLPKTNPERKQIISNLRKMGNFKFNTNSEINTGELIVSRRPNEKVNKTAIDFTACAKCQAFYAKSTIRHHARQCYKKDFRKNKSIMVMGRKITNRIHPLANETLRNMVFPVMRDDIITRIVRYDELLILYANKLCVKYKAQHQHDMIRARLRVLGRFLLALKEINKNIEDFQSLYHPKVYDDCISAINRVAKYDDEQQLYKTPAVAANLSTLVKYIGNLLITECIKREDEAKKKLVKDFLKLLIVDVGTSVNKTVLETQSTHKRHKKINLPSLEDIQTLHKYLTKKRIEAYTALKESFSYEKWLSLAKVTLTSMHVFNRRRAGEIERVLIQDFENYEKLNENMYTDIYNSLSIEDKEIAQKYVRFCIRGKLGRTVPVLLPNDLFECVTLILKFRKKANIPKKNPYIFGLPGLNKHRYRYLRACILMREFARECNASCPATLRGTTLRKHIATHCIQLNLNDTDVTDLATFMGHADKIHRQHYRQPLASRDILKISKYLEAVQGTQDTNTQDSNDESSSDMELEMQTNSKENVSLSNNEIDTTTSSLNDTSNHIDCQGQKNKNGKRKRSTSPYGKTKRIRWTEEESEVVLREFAKYIDDPKALPSLKEVQDIRKKYKCLTRRKSPQIKTWFFNMKKKIRENKELSQIAVHHEIRNITETQRIALARLSHIL